MPDRVSDQIVIDRLREKAAEHLWLTIPGNSTWPMTPKKRRGHQRMADAYLRAAHILDAYWVGYEDGELPDLTLSRQKQEKP